MTGSLYNAGRRQYLVRGWSLAATPAGAVERPDPATLGALDWISIERLAPVAAALRTIGRWSLDASPRRFDAEDWWYRLRFPAAEVYDCGDDKLSVIQIILGFDGLATIAHVWLNGREILSSDNMFVAHEVALGDALEDDNDLVLRFRALDTCLAKRRPRPRWRAPMVEHQQLRWFRTTLLGRTPGWSPPAAPVGPWRPIWLETRDPKSVVNASLHARMEGTTGIVEVECEIPEATVDHTVFPELTVTRADMRYATVLARKDGSTFAGALRITAPDLWWPHTHGEPALYKAELQLRPVEPGTHAPRSEGRPLASTVAPVDSPHIVDLGQFGFRTLSLDIQEGDFLLRVNGVPIFCRGACWTPLDCTTLHVEAADYDAAMALVASAGMNMLRVSGTMVYESEAFLEACDRHGMLLWQEFMFANMDYPEGDTAFDASVTQEINQVLSTFASHPCIAVICGNSEVAQQSAMWGASREYWSPRLFHEVIPRIVRERLPDVPYWPSSAHGGAFPHQNDTGTTSYYGVGAYLRPLEDCRHSGLRFATESLAFANVPEDDTLARMPGGTAGKTHHPGWKARTPRDLGAGWDFDDVRDYYLQRLFGIDALQLRYADHQRYLELSRIVSGEVMYAAFSEWRRRRSSCNGALVWFLRDLWPGAGWGVLDAAGRPKAAWYYLCRALKPRALFISDEGCNGLMLHLTNDNPSPLQGTLALSLYRSGKVVVAKGECAVDIGARETAELPAAALFEGFYDLSWAYRFGPPAYDVAVATLSTFDATRPLDAYYFPTGYAIAESADLGLTAKAIPISDRSYELRLHTEGFARVVTIRVEGFICDDQYFHLAPGTERTLTLQAIGSAPPRVPHGTIHALNAASPTPIEWTRPG